MIVWEHKSIAVWRVGGDHLAIVPWNESSDAYIYMLGVNDKPSSLNAYPAEDRHRAMLMRLVNIQYHVRLMEPQFC